MFLKWLLNWRLQVHKLCIRLVENLSLNYVKIIVPNYSVAEQIDT